jgi:flagella basal body P-ring formation protein FlgA
VRCGRTLLEERAAKPGAEVTIEDPEMPRAVVVADAGVELKAETQARRLAGLVPVTVEVWSGGERAARVMLSYRVKARASAVQAARNLEAGSILAAGDLQEVEADLSELPDDAVTSGTALVGQRVLRPLSAGAWIPRAAVAQPLQVRRGSPVTLLARIGTVEARASAQAKQDGSSGEIISVVNLSSKRTLRARVTGEGLVEAVLQ